MNSLGLIIGRFQPLHLGHQLLIETSLEENSTTLVLIGSINKKDSNNPYSYDLRKEMIHSTISFLSSKERGGGKGIIGSLPDFSNDEQWKDYILSYIPNNIEELTLYCGDIKNDSAVKSLLSLKDTLPFTLIIKEIPRSIIPVSATQIRKWIQNDNISNLKKYLSKKILLFLGITL